MQVGSAGAFSTSISGTAFGMDFNPVPDRIRLVSDTRQNLRIHPDLGTLVSADGALNPAGNVVAVAYSNNFAGATSTTLYAASIRFRNAWHHCPCRILLTVA